MRIYVASSWRNEYQPGVVALLRELGHEVYDFRNPAPGNNGFSWAEIDENWQQWTSEQYTEALKHPIAQKGFELDFNGMQWADACVIVLPCGRSANSEAGWMKGAGKKVFVYQPTEQEPELMYKMYDGILLDEISLINTFTIPPKPLNLIEEVRGIEDVFRLLKVDPAQYAVEDNWSNKQKADMYLERLMLAEDLFNGDVLIDMADTSQNKYRPWFEIIKDANDLAGFRLAYDGYVCGHAYTPLGARPEFIKSGHAVHVGKVLLLEYEKLAQYQQLARNDRRRFPTCVGSR